MEWTSFTLGAIAGAGFILGLATIGIVLVTSRLKKYEQQMEEAEREGLL